jgi:hypothetical protein
VLVQHGVVEPGIGADADPANEVIDLAAPVQTRGAERPAQVGELP